MPGCPQHGIRRLLGSDPLRGHPGDPGTSVIATDVDLDRLAGLTADLHEFDVHTVVGDIVAAGTVDELKSAQRCRVVLVTAHERDLAEVAAILGRVARTVPEIDRRLRRVEATVASGQSVLTAVMGELRGVEVLEAGLRRASLDDVFLDLVTS